MRVFRPTEKVGFFFFFFGVRVFRLERDFGGGEGEFSEMKEGRELNGIELNGIEWNGMPISGIV